MTAKFIVIEGLEGAGKSTAIAVCQAYLENKQIEFINVREPGGTPMAEELRSIVKQAHQETVTSETELLIMYAARSQLVANVIEPALKKGTWVLGDRHDLSSQAYQGGGRGIEQEQLSFLADMVLKGLKPDLTIYLDIEPAVGLERAKGRGELDRIEQEALGFFERTRERYLEIASTDNSIKTVDANQTMPAVHAAITSVLDEFFKGVN
ncbi:dTMP kinase [uncultured Pseudoalteromonas sp.]|uniref:dTMP kinase n=1 Tax=uncultured Pseudoalteromonas sp. TaxID=114053 RepID=UPI000C6A819A|nr:dTMP kinase [uncultured Pseudoalteromonas sp.]MBD56856.1 dTMP kinase [Pseudoalteromonas sp.]|tara:strand:+ start:567 stop:1193 length:627 start_codon:yes stop_codon:yes gene_type:complete